GLGAGESRGDEPRRRQRKRAQVEPDQARVLGPGPPAAPDHGLGHEREEEEPGGGHERPHGRRRAGSPTSAARFAWASALDGSRRTARRNWPSAGSGCRSEEHTSELQSPCNLVCRLLLEKKNTITVIHHSIADEIVVLTMIEHRHSDHPRILDGAPHQFVVLDAASVVGERIKACLSARSD